MYIQPIYVVVQQKLTQYCKAVIKKIFFSNFHICPGHGEKAKIKYKKSVCFG